MDCKITYIPTGNAMGKIEEEKIVMKIVDGVNQVYIFIKRF